MLQLRRPASYSARCQQQSVACRPRPSPRAVARPRAAADAAASNSTAANPAAGAAQPPPRLDARAHDENRRVAKKRRAAQGGSPQEQAVLHAGAAVADGPLPEVLSASFPALFPTLSAARRVIRKDQVLVAGQLGSCKTDVTAGQLLQQLEPVPQQGKVRAVTLQVAYEDDEVAVVQKPWGVKMYGGDARRTIAGALRAGALQPSSAADALPEPKAVHRLDAAVGGLLVVAKTAGAAAALSQQWRERCVHKVYTALVCGRLEPAAAAARAAAAGEALQAGEASTDTGDEDEEAQDASAGASDSSQQQGSSEELPEVLLPLPELLQLQLQGQPPFAASAADLGLDPALVLPPTGLGDADGAASSEASSEASSSDAAGAAAAAAAVHVVDLPLEGKPCYSLYSVLGYSRSSRFGGWLTSVALSPVTGRKHQLRRHCAALGHPILGDGKYLALDNKAEHVGNQGIFLESTEVWFEHPTTGERLQLRIPEPKRFATMRAQQHSRWRKLSGGGGDEAGGEAAAEAADAS